jgi:peptidoglycan hydrolase-like protein with peptidoglycan-binding domain
MHKRLPFSLILIGLVLISAPFAVAVAQTDAAAPAGTVTASGCTIAPDSGSGGKCSISIAWNVSNASANSVIVSSIPVPYTDPSKEITIATGQSAVGGTSFSLSAGSYRIKLYAADASGAVKLLNSADMTIAPALGDPNATPHVLTLAELYQMLTALTSRIQQLQAQKESGIDTSTGLGCLELTFNMAAGSTDAETNGEVTRLQQFLAHEGLLDAGSVVGTYGPQTQAAVEKWQASHGIVSAGTPDTTGYGTVGPATRSAIFTSGLCATAAPTTDTSNPAPRITEFSFNGANGDATAPSGESIAINWHSVNTTGCSVYLTDGMPMDVAPDSGLTLNSRPSDNLTYHYNLTCKGKDGTSVTASRTLTLTPTIAAGSDTSKAYSCININADVQQGSTGPNVKLLQEFLLSQYADFDASDADGTFGQTTKAAITQWQTEHGISGTGYVGPLTRAKIAQMTGCGSSAAGTDITAPTASLKVNGTEAGNVTLATTDTVNYAWNSTGGTSWTSAYTATSCDDPSLNKSNAAWTANTASGFYGPAALTAWGGCAVAITYTVTNSLGQHANSSVYVHVKSNTVGANTSCTNGLNKSAYPSCTCPTGQTQSGSSCVDSSNTASTQTCPTGTTGTYPNCTSAATHSMTGSLNVPSSCTIAAGATTCPITISWTGANQTTTSLGIVDAPYTNGETFLWTSVQQTGTNTANLAAGSHRIKLYGSNSSSGGPVLLNYKDIVVNSSAAETCPAGTTGTYPNCTSAANATAIAPAGTLTANSCTPLAGSGASGTCSINIAWSDSNVQTNTTAISIIAAPFTDSTTERFIWQAQPQSGSNITRVNSGTYRIKLYGTDSAGAVKLITYQDVTIPAAPDTASNTSNTANTNNTNSTNTDSTTNTASGKLAAPAAAWAQCITLGGQPAAQFSWNDSTSPGVTGYYLFVYDKTTNQYLGTNNASSFSNSSKGYAVNVPAGDTIAYWVYAHNDNWSQQSDATSGTPITCSASQASTLNLNLASALVALEAALQALLSQLQR